MPLELFDWFIHYNYGMLLFYWIPTAICLLYFIDLFINDYQYDLGCCMYERYTPKATIGSLFLAIILPFIPVYNIAVPILLIYTYIPKFFNIGLVSSKYESSIKIRSK